MSDGPGPTRRWRAVLFDLDGTLVDTRPGMTSALASAYLEVTGRDPGVDSANLSLPLEEMVRSADPSVPPETVVALVKAFRQHYDGACWVMASPYPGAEACLRALRGAGIRLFVVTNKRSSAALRLLGHLDWTVYLEDVVGQPDAGPNVPKMKLAAMCMDHASLDAETTIVVGDSDSDAEMAAARGLVFVAITSGSGPLGHAPADGQRVEVEQLADVTTFVLSTHPGRYS